MLQEDSQGVLRSPRLAAFPWLEHGFGTRAVSAWPPPGTALLKQIHSDQIVNVADAQGLVGEGDALVTATVGQCVGVKTADCLPLLLIDPLHRAVAAVHAGWRGTVAEIAVQTVHRMKQQFGSEPERIIAVLGPAIGPCCFQVGAEVAARFREWFPERADLDQPTTIDLPTANYRQLLKAGLRPELIDDESACTTCDRVKFFSFRRDRHEAGRMISAVRVLTAA